MARILICHVPKDGGLARDLGALLMGRGHFVSFDGEPDVPKEDRPARLRQFEAVVVMWTETSAQSGGLSDIATETMPLNILVPVRSETLSPSELPLKFRKLNMFGPRDVDGLSRLVARLSHAQSSIKEMTARDAQREASYAAEPPYQRPIVPQAPMRPAPPPEKPQKPALPVFVKQRSPAPTPEPQPQAVAPPVPHVERPSFPPKMAKTADAPEAPPAAAATPPLPPFVTRRLSPNSAAAPVEAPVPSQKPQQPRPRDTASPTPRTAEPAAPKAPGHESAWAALADELGEPANPVVAPVSSRPHAPYGRSPIASRPPPAAATPSYMEDQDGPPYEPPMPMRRPAPPAAPPLVAPPPEPPLRAAAAPSYASLRPQAPPPLAPPSPSAGPPPLRGAPPPLPSRDGLGAGSPSFSAVAMAQHLARLVEGGLLLIYIPEATWLGEPITTEVRLGREVLDEAQGDPRSSHDRITIDTISVSLISDDPGFSIERQSERTQFVGQRFHDLKGAASSGRWAWLVTPHTPGDYDLIIRISALVRDRSGVPTPVALPDRRYSIAVHAREARAR